MIMEALRQAKIDYRDARDAMLRAQAAEEAAEARYEAVLEACPDEAALEGARIAWEIAMDRLLAAAEAFDGAEAALRLVAGW
jgi:hypothetical protein